MKPQSALYGGLFLQFRLFAPKKRKDEKTQICCGAKRRKNENVGRKFAASQKRRKNAKLRGERRKDEILGRSFAACVSHLFAFILSSVPVFSGQNDKKNPKKQKTLNFIVPFY